MTPEVPRLHHVSVIGGDAANTTSFFLEVLGLRLVKRTVNHDDPQTYHLYFGDGAGTPGTNITYFPWGDAGRRGRFGEGQTQWTAYGVPPGSLEYWGDRLEEHGVAYERHERFGEEGLSFSDPDGVGIELVGTDDDPDEWTPWAGSPVPQKHQLRGFQGVTLAVGDTGSTRRVLETIGFELEAEADDGRLRLRTRTGGLGSVVDLVETDEPRGTMGVGTVHHVAFEAADREEEADWQDVLRDLGLRPTEIIDRTYFHSIYVREPGGVLFEFATPEPGFTVDEPVGELGTSLQLPPWLEDEREDIEASLPPLGPGTQVVD